MDSVSHTTGLNVSHMPSRNAGAEPDTFQRIEIIKGFGGVGGGVLRIRP